MYKTKGLKIIRTTKKANSYVQGFTLLELMISMSVGLVLFAGIMSVFVGLRTTSEETSSFGELQENGRFAVSVLTDDLLKQDFWGDYTGPMAREILVSAVPASPDNDCVGGGTNNATFPLPAGNGKFRTLWGQTFSTDVSNPFNDCFDNPTGTQSQVGSDIIQFKRAIAIPLLADVAGNYYLTANVNNAAFHLSGGAPAMENSRLWEYQHHIYYIREEQQKNGDFIPVLMRGRLANLAMSFNQVVDGIELIRFMYGVDTTGDGVINTYLSSDNMTDTIWDNGNNTRILAVKMYVLARSIIPDNKYINTNTYQLGDLLYNPTPDDNYRRLLFSSTVTLYNARID